MAEFNLVKYDTPKVIGEAQTLTEENKQTDSDSSKYKNTKNKFDAINVLPPIHASNETEFESLQEILDCVLPPSQWEENGKLYMKSVSSVPSTRLDILNLQEELDAKLIERQAKPYGICPVRRELYDQCFDEILRQVTINCAERGVLLMRVRDELRMTLDAYDALYESSIAFGIRKALGSEEKKFESELEVTKLKEKVSEMEEKIEHLEFQLKEQEEEYNRKKEIMKQRYMDDTERLKKANQQLKSHIEALIVPIAETTQNIVKEF